MISRSLKGVTRLASNHDNFRTLRRASACLIATILATGAFALPAAAQWRVGGFLGGEHDSSWDEFLVIGADARGTLKAQNIELNPRFTYFLREGTTRFQIEFNAIKPLALASSSKLVPYMGAGLALEKVSYDGGAADSQTSVGFNYIMGSTIKVSGPVQPFAQFSYTVLNDAPNTALLTFGLHFRLGSR